MGQDRSTADTTERLLQATDDALQKHGYADLSMAKVAAEFDGSQSLIHYHFDSREGLLASYVAWKREQYREFLTEFPDDPEQRLTSLLTTFVREFEEWASTDRGQAMMDLYAEGRDSETVAEELRRLDALFRDAFREAVAEGIDAGVFRENVDPDGVARLLLAASDGTAARWSVGERDEGEPIADAVETYVLDRIRVDED